MAIGNENVVHVGDLPEDASEDFLTRFFSDVGTVRRVVVKNTKRDAKGRPICYAFVTFDKPEEVARAIERHNYTKFNGTPIRISRADAETWRILRSGEGILFVKNLDPDVEVAELHDALGNFGDIISCKLPMDDGKARGYAYVQFRRPADAERARIELGEASINGRPVVVMKYTRREPRNPETTFTNVYIKNLPESVKTDEDLSQLFAEFGEVSSAKLAIDDQGVSRRFGFCAMGDQAHGHEHALAAIEGLNDKEVDNCKLVATRAKDKAEREREVRKEGRTVRSFTG